MICVYNKDIVSAQGQEHRLHSPIQAELIARHIAWQAVFQKIDFQMEDEGRFGKKFQQTLTQTHLAADMLLSEASDYECLIGKNAKTNSQLPFRSGLALKNQWKGLPAIVVGAGPSLEQSAPLLKTVGDRALILAGGTAASLLGIKPHFVGAVDKYKALTSFPDVPLLTQLRAHPDGWAVHPQRIVFPDSSSRWLNGILGVEEPFDSGWTVGNFLVAVALWAGCDPIVLVGMDFSYTSEIKKGLVQTEAGIWTQKDWIMAAHWMQGKPCINTTPRGLLPQNGSLEQVLSQLSHPCPNPGLPPFIKMQNEVAVNDTLLDSLWSIWRPVFEREGGDLELHRRLFFMRILEEHQHAY